MTWRLKAAYFLHCSALSSDTSIQSEKVCQSKPSRGVVCGTNQFHGSREDRITLPELVNRSYFETMGNKYTYHEATGTVGGPVYFPKIYSG